MSPRLIFWRIGGPYALSRWSVVLPLALLLVLRLVDQGPAASGRSWAYVAATAAGMMAVAIAAIAAWATYLRPDGRGPRPVAALLTFFALGCLRTAGVAAAEALLGVPLSRPVLPELLIGGVQGTVVLALIAIWVDSQRQFRDARRGLLVVRDRIRATHDLAKVRVADLLGALVAEVAARVDERWRALAADSPDLPAAATALRGVSEEYVRPLSHEIHRQWMVDHLTDLVEPVDRTGSDRPAGRRGLAEIHAIAADLRAPNPYVVTGVTLLLGIGTRLRVLGPTTTALLIAVTVPVMVVGGFLVGRLVEHRRGHPVAAPAALVLGSLAVVATSVILDVALLAWTTGSADWLLTTIATYTFVAIIVSLGRTAFALEDASQRQLATSIVEESAAWEASSAHLARLQEVTTHFLHDAVQAELVASALMLQRAPASDVDIDHELGLAYARMAAEIGAACAETLVPARERVLQHLEFWSDAADLAYTVDPRCWDLLDQRPATAAALSRVLSVGLTNAIRHGHRGPITLSMGVAHDDGVLVTLTSPGYLGEFSSGDRDVPTDRTTLGLAAIDSVSRGWSLSGADDSVTLQAVV